jgi:hypothetical protein
MIPSSVKIGAQEYPVSFETKETLGDNLLGECGYHAPFIKVLDSLPECRKQQAFIHEMVHVLLFEAGFTWNIYDNEKVVRPLANMLYQVLKDNKLYFGDDTTVIGG